MGRILRGKDEDVDMSSASSFCYRAGRVTNTARGVRCEAYGISIMLTAFTCRGGGGESRGF